MTRWMRWRPIALALGFWLAFAPALLAVPAGATAFVSAECDHADGCDECPEPARADTCAFACLSLIQPAIAGETSASFDTRDQQHLCANEPSPDEGLRPPEPAPPKSPPFL